MATITLKLIEAYLRDCDELNMLTEQVKDKIASVKDDPESIRMVIYPIIKNNYFNEDGNKMKHLYDVYNGICMKCPKYYKEIVTENFKELAEAFIIDVSENREYLDEFGTSVLDDIVSIKNGEKPQIIYNIIEHDCCKSYSERYFREFYFANCHILYIELWEKHEEKLLQEAFDKLKRKFANSEDVINVIEILVTKPNAYSILKML